MTVRVTFHQTCDRCSRPFGSELLNQGQQVPVVKSEGLKITRVHREISGSGEITSVPVRDVVCFDDLCPDCENAVANLIKRIRLEPELSERKRSKKEDRPSKKPAGTLPDELAGALVLDPLVEWAVETGCSTVEEVTRRLLLVRKEKHVPALAGTDDGYLSLQIDGVCRAMNLCEYKDAKLPDLTEFLVDAVGGEAETELPPI